MNRLERDDWHEHRPVYDDHGKLLGWAANTEPDHINTPRAVALLIAQMRWGPDANVGKPPPRLTG